MAELLDTTAISSGIEKLIKSAREQLILISPFLRLRERLRQQIGDAANRGVRVRVVYGKSRQCDEVKRLQALNGVQLAFCENVHAKCYINEEFGIITSLNLYDFSEARNLEMGVLFRRECDGQLYQDALEEAERIVRFSGADASGLESLASNGKSPLETAASGKLETKELARARAMLSTVLFHKLLGRGYLELGPDKKRRLSEKGKEMGGESSGASASLFLWPPDLEV